MKNIKQYFSSHADFICLAFACMAHLLLESCRNGPLSNQMMLMSENQAKLNDSGELELIYVINLIIII